MHGYKIVLTFLLLNALNFTINNQGSPNKPAVENYMQFLTTATPVSQMLTTSHQI